MTTQTMMFSDIKWHTRQRLLYIEVMAYYCGLVTRSDIANAFRLSDAAATKDLKLYNDLAPSNLVYRQNLFGYVPTLDFAAMFSDLNPRWVLPMLASNLTTNATQNSPNIYGVPCVSAALPYRLPEKLYVAQITQAIKWKKKLAIFSIGDNPGEAAIIEPHTLISQNSHWYARAFCENHYEFRNIDLSHLSKTKQIDEPAESDANYDEEWNDIVTLELAPHPHLDQRRQKLILGQYDNEGDCIRVQCRRALMDILLKQLAVDTSTDASLNPDTHSLYFRNRNALNVYSGS
ncbi:MAG: WYL domain-containing protein [Gammaproteobacteria bacterium]|nr:WYL domain-containing protein [Gammaproteobacteria bacterium]